ncbi:MAG TPA: tetratricopeptide repeat protein [Kofleriaceae bacterium]|nr:tetratricopeptide repeat protein [Kofleriaceae bacterium]
MRSLPRVALAALVTLAACGGRAAHPTLPPAPVAPARDLATARDGAVRVDASDGGLAAKDPRVIDLDIIRVQVGTAAPGREAEPTVVAAAELFRQATDAAKDGRHREALATYRRLVAELPESRYAPVSLFNIAAIYDQQGDLSATIAALRELVAAYPSSRESVEGHLYIAALQSEKAQWPDALATLDAVLARTSLTLADRVEAHARRGYVLLELARYDAAETALAAALADWRRAPRIEDPYYIAMAHYYRGELVHRRFAASPIRLPDDQLAKDLEARRVLAAQAYDRWKESLGYRHAYWATASGYQMSQIFVELWEVTAKAPYPARLSPAQRARYVAEVHERVRIHLEKALEGHRMNVELAKAYGVETAWSKASEVRATEVLDLLAREARGEYVTPAGSP